MTDINLSEQQQSALDAFNAGQNIFLTGPGGSGKSVLIRHIVEACEDSGKTVQVCALTGCATVLLGCPGAKTLHSWAGIGLANGTNYQVVDRVVKNKFKRNTWNSIDVLVVDEVSMLSKKLFDVLDEIGRRARRALDTPFGGIQVVFSGDFYQLPPVGNADEPDTSAFCFESECWESTFEKTIQLSRIFRQTDDTYTKVLNQIRVGKLTKSSFKVLTDRVNTECEERLIRPTILMPRRRDVDLYNAAELKKLEGDEHEFHAGITRDAPASANARPAAQFSDKQNEMEYKHLRSGMMADERLVLKVGAQVMCVVNLDMEEGIINGSQGVVVEFEQGMPVVEFRSGITRCIGRHVWASDTIQGLGATQVPLIHAWAITIHKAQGVTLELARIDAGNNIFESGQTYVALSRVKSLDGLFLTAFNPQKIRVNKKVQQYYQNVTKSIDVYQHGKQKQLATLA